MQKTVFHTRAVLMHIRPILSKMYYLFHATDLTILLDGLVGFEYFDSRATELEKR